MWCRAPRLHAVRQDGDQRPHSTRSSGHRRSRHVSFDVRDRCSGNSDQTLHIRVDGLDITAAFLPSAARDRCIPLSFCNRRCACVVGDRLGIAAARAVPLRRHDRGNGRPVRHRQQRLRLHGASDRQRGPAGGPSMSIFIFSPTPLSITTTPWRRGHHGNAASAGKVESDPHWSIASRHAPYALTRCRTTDVSPVRLNRRVPVRCQVDDGLSRRRAPSRCGRERPSRHSSRSIRRPRRPGLRRGQRWRRYSRRRWTTACRHADQCSARARGCTRHPGRHGRTTQRRDPRSQDFGVRCPHSLFRPIVSFV